MPIRPVLQLGDPVLREKAVAVEDPAALEIQELVRDLADTLAHWRSVTGYGRGIAAPQLGVLRRVIFLKLPGCRAVAADQSGDHPTQRRNNCRLGCVSEFSFDLHAGGAAP